MISTFAFACVLLSAFLHALWNAIVRTRPEPGEALAAQVVMAGLISLPFILFTGLPAAASWPWLVAGVIINSVGIRLAMAAYRAAPYALAYPIMRAGIPLMALPVGILLFHEWPSLKAGAGVLLISASLIMLAFIAHASGRAALRGVAMALLASACGAGYVVCDAMGVRLSGGMLAYSLAVAVGNALVVALMVQAENRNLRSVMRRQWRFGGSVAVLSMTSFILYMSAVATTPVALAAALRETSVFFAMGLAVVLVKEKIGKLHWGAAGLAVAGVAAIRLA